MKVINDITGETIEIDKAKMRLARCQRRVHAWANLLSDYTKDTANYRVVMITLTYANIEDWRAGHIRAFMYVARRQLKSKLIAYAWVAELQKRGAVHYHVLLVCKRGANIPQPDKAGWWVMGSTRIETAKSMFYIVTYTGKEYQKVGKFPKGLRLFAVWASEKVLNGIARFIFKLTAIPAWLRAKILDTGNLGGKIKRVYGGGWRYDEKFYKSPWRLSYR